MPSSPIGTELAHVEVEEVKVTVPRRTGSSLTVTLPETVPLEPHPADRINSTPSQLAPKARRLLLETLCMTVGLSSRCGRSGPCGPDRPRFSPWLPVRAKVVAVLG